VTRCTDRSGCDYPGYLEGLSGDELRFPRDAPECRGCEGISGCLSLRREHIPFFRVRRDTRMRYRSSDLPFSAEPLLNSYQGPSLVVFNNSIFTKEDKSNILQISNSAKAKDLNSVGRFGRGFNCSYYVTGALSCFLDPSNRVLRCTPAPLYWFIIPL
jgi:hypothetical protein